MPVISQDFVRAAAIKVRKLIHSLQDQFQLFPGGVNLASTPKPLQTFLESGNDGLSHVFPGRSCYFMDKTLSFRVFDVNGHGFNI